MTIFFSSFWIFASHSDSDNLTVTNKIEEFRYHHYESIKKNFLETVETLEKITYQTECKKALSSVSVVETITIIRLYISLN